MSDICFDEQGAPVTTPAAGVGQYWTDNIPSLPFYFTDTPRKHGRSHRSSVASQTGFASDTYVANSGILIPSFGLQAETMFEWSMSVSKTAAGVATPIYRFRIGATQSTADPIPITFTGPAQTAVADIGILTILVTVRNVGSAGVFQGIAIWNHDAPITGFAVTDAGAVQGTSAGVDNSAAAGGFAGITINGGASAAWTITQVRANAIW